jgi:hypothetical protein
MERSHLERDGIAGGDARKIEPHLSHTIGVGASVPARLPTAGARNHRHVRERDRFLYTAIIDERDDLPR